MASGVENLRPEHPRPRQLSELAIKLGLASAQLPSVEVSGVSASSQETLAGDVFFALPGAKTHGVTFAPDAIDRGAVAIVTDQDGASKLSDVAVPVFAIADPR
ncbi:MAG: UDP-N-acetylmuramoyl-L-alanyl-D-glutamate--2,6-diaminopimelate ligase, partial [Actinomycetota bacterium]